MPADQTDLESLPTPELHDRAIKRALRHLDLGFLWRLLESIPAAEAAAGHLDEAEVDAFKMSALIDDLVNAGDKDVGDMLRPIYINYLRGKG